MQLEVMPESPSLQPLSASPSGPPEPAQAVRALRLRQALILTATVLVLGLIWLGLATNLRDHRAQNDTEVHAALSRNALLVEEQLNRQFLVSDQTLRILEAGWQADPDGFRLDALHGQLVAMQDKALQIFITDAKGIVTQSTRPEILGTDVSTRDYFRHEQRLARDDDRLFINPPVRGMVTRQWQLNLVRRLDYGDGRFGGVVSLALPTAALDSFYTTVDLGAHGMVGLVSLEDGSLLSQPGPGLAQQFDSLIGTALLERIRGQHEDIWTGPTPSDGAMRIHAFIPVKDRDVSVIVGIGQADAQHPYEIWRLQALLVTAWAALFVIACSALLLQATHAAFAREGALSQDRLVLQAANTALEEARAEAQERALRMRAVLAGMTDGIMMLDSRLRLLEWNAHFSEYTGVPEEILHVGLPMREILLSQARQGEFGNVAPEAEVERRLALLDGKQPAGTTERVRPNGRVLEIRRNRLPSGGFVTLYADVTERRVAIERLHQAQTMAAVGRLTAGLAHDFNNLLASIILNAEMLHEDLEPQPELARRVGVILQATNRGAALVRQLLAFSRKQELVASRVDLNETILAMRDIIHTSIGAGVRLETVLQPDLGLVLVDLVQIENVILNLVINARDAMPKGGVLRIVTAHARLGPPIGPDDLPAGAYVGISITDTGIGMTEEVRRNAFDPFFTTKDAGKGSGLGLSQVYGVTRQSGGGTEIISAPGRGTTIRILLPLVSD